MNRMVGSRHSFGKSRMACVTPLVFWAWIASIRQGGRPISAKASRIIWRRASNSSIRSRANTKLPRPTRDAAKRVAQKVLPAPQAAAEKVMEIGWGSGPWVKLVKVSSCLHAPARVWVGTSLREGERFSGAVPRGCPHADHLDTSAYEKAKFT